MGNISEKFVGKIKTHFVFSKLFSRKSCYLLDNVGKHLKNREAADGNMALAHCMLDK
jgi:hypothetical protein